MNGLKHHRILITSGASFIGPAVVHCLSEQGKYKSVVFSNKIQRDFDLMMRPAFGVRRERRFKFNLITEYDVVMSTNDSDQCLAVLQKRGEA